MSLQPVKIATGYLQASPEDAQQHFTIWQIAEDAVELRYDASGIKTVIRVDIMAGYELRLAIERKTRRKAKFEFTTTPGPKNSPFRRLSLYEQRVNAEMRKAAIARGGG